MRGARQVGWLGTRLALAQGRLLPWAAVLMATGAALWLGWPGPTRAASVGAAGLFLLGAAWAFRGSNAALRAGAAGLLALSLGFLGAEWRSAQVAAPVLGFRYYGVIEGRVVEIDRSATNRLRLTLDRVTLTRVPVGRRPDRVRISLQGEQPNLQIVAGMRLRTTGHLAPPEGPTEPGGFDFQRHAWFKGIGAIGYSRLPVEILAPPSPREAMVTRLRHHLSGAIQRARPGEAGAFAAAMLTGDRSGMGPEAVQALRDANLYHLVSISGVHMSLLTGFVFLGFRSALALVPPLALRLPVHKIAALIALGVAAFYLVLAGGDVATTRAFVMVAVMLVAVLSDRRALSLRSVALAMGALILWQPEAVADPGFQMSFAATAALIAGYRALAPWLAPGRVPVWLRLPLSMLAASALAGMASAPFAALHFNRYSEYGLIANLMVSPLMGLVVMPAGALAALLAPFGLAAPALWVLEMGCRLILSVAEEVAGWHGAVRLVPDPGPMVLPLLGFGLAGLILWRGWGRAGGLAALALAALLWSGAMRPSVLVASDGQLIGVLGPEGRALSRAKGAGFTARNWLENDGDPVQQSQAAARAGLVHGAKEVAFAIGRARGLHLLGKGAAARVAGACRRAEVVVLAELSQIYPRGCLVLDLTALRRLGAVALELTPAGELELSAAKAVDRPWGPRPPPARRGPALGAKGPKPLAQLAP